MMILQNFRIGTRLTAAFMLIIAMMAAVTAVGMVELSEVTNDTRMIVQDRLVKLQLSQTIENEVNRQSRAVRTALISANEQAIAKELEKIEDSKPLVARALATLEQTIHTPEGSKALKEMMVAHQEFLAHEHALIDMIKQGQQDRGR